MTSASPAIPINAHPHAAAAAVSYARGGVVLLAVIAAVAALLLFGDRVQEREEQRRIGEHVQRDLAAIKQGRGEDIFIYEPELMARIAAEPQAVANATTLVFSRTDLSDPRFAEIKKLKVLQNVAIDSCKNADSMLLHMQGMVSVEKLWLEDSPVSQRGIKALAALPNLKHVRFEQFVTPDEAKLLKRTLPNVNLRLPSYEFRAGR
ncbi:MAG TPA: hypothetical protein VF175_03315 [Lacipirellula sp.]